MVKCYLEGHLGRLDAILDNTKGIWDNCTVTSTCRTVSIKVNPFVARDRIETTEQGDRPVFYYS